MTAPKSPLAEALRDRYTLERELGRGGMATVYLARDLRHQRYVALKVLAPELATAVGVERFQREIQLAASLQFAAGRDCSPGRPLASHFRYSSEATCSDCRRTG